MRDLPDKKTVSTERESCCCAASRQAAAAKNSCTLYSPDRKIRFGEGVKRGLLSAKTGGLLTPICPLPVTQCSTDRPPVCFNRGNFLCYNSARLFCPFFLFSVLFFWLSTTLVWFSNTTHSFVKMLCEDTARQFGLERGDNRTARRRLKHVGWAPTRATRSSRLSRAFIIQNNIRCRFFFRVGQRRHQKWEFFAWKKDPAPPQSCSFF